MKPTEKALYDFLKEIVYDRNIYTHDGQPIFNVSHLREDELKEAISLCMEVYDRDIEECFSDNSINDDVTCSLLSVLKKDDSSSRNELVSMIINRTISKYSGLIQEYLDLVCTHKLNDLFYENDNLNYQYI